MKKVEFFTDRKFWKKSENSGAVVLSSDILRVVSRFLLGTIKPDKDINNSSRKINQTARR